jgi:hypothetical protein
MGTNYPTASAVNSWHEGVPALMPPYGLGGRAGVFGPVKTIFLRVRRWLETFNAMRREHTRGGGGPPPIPPEDHRKYDSIWDDPELWTMMMH